MTDDNGHHQGPASQGRDEGVGRTRARVLFLVLLVNLLGGLVLFVYFSVIEVSSLSMMRFIQSWETLLLVLVPGVLAVLFSGSYSRDVFEYLRVVKKLGFTPLSEKDGGGRIIHVRRRALRLPVVCALASLLGWVAMGLFIGGRILLSGRPGLSDSLSLVSAPGEVSDLLSEGLYRSGTMLRRQWMMLVQGSKGLGLSVLTGGMISAIIFFLVESVWQRELPRFFPRGTISAVGDRWIIPVRYRLIAIFVLVGTVPLVLLGVLSYQRSLALVYSPPEDVLSSLLMFNLFMVLVGIGLAVLLSGYVARSVSEPLERLGEGMEQVKRGDFSVQVPVRSNDELGLLTDGFDDMVRVLAENAASIRELTHGLEEKVRERTQELEEVLAEKERTQEQLVQSEKMAGLGQLVAGVAHEINNPVGYVYANTDHLGRCLDRLRQAFESGDREAFAETSAKAQKLVASTREGAQRTKEIVQGLRTFSRKDPGLKKPVEVHEAIMTALMLLGHELKQGIKVTKDFSKPAWVMGNPGELSQVFMNIIVNAIQAVDQEGEIAIATREQGEKVVVSVKDTGAGIAKEDMAHLFEPFFTTKEVGQGTGLGLSIAYGIIKDHGGEIEVKSLRGRGTEVVVSLNRAESSA